MAIKKSELYSSLWQSCDELRGGMDASQYKDYVLALLFVKYVSDKYAGQPDALIEVPAGGGFADMLALRGDPEIGDKINKIIGKLAAANALEGAIDVADFNDAEKLGQGKELVDRLSNLVAIFATPALDFRRNRAEGDDLLGDAYEYLMRHFATESGKSKGQFYTPAEISRVMAKVIGLGSATGSTQTIHDPACGSGSLLIKAHDEARSATGLDLAIYGQEMDNGTAALAKMNMILHNCPTAEIWQGNTLAAPHFTQEGGRLKTFDFVVANPPFSAKAWNNGIDPANDSYGRFAYGIPPAKNGDYAFLLHVLATLKSTGKGAVILPHGVLFRGNAEAAIRTQIVRRGYIKGIIGLPPNLFYGTGIPACIVVLDKEHTAARRGIFMVDASRGFVKDGNKNRLRAQDVHKIVDAFTKRLEISGYSRLVPLAEIAANDHNLNLPRYVDSTEPKDLQDIEAHLRGGIPNRDIDALERYWRVLPAVRAALFEPAPWPGYSRLKVAAEDINATILQHAEFAAFKESASARFSQWKTAHTPLLRDLTPGSHPKGVIECLSESLLHTFQATTLLDAYAVYQRLMTYWTETMQDDVYLIASDGWQPASQLRLIVDEKDSKNKEQADLVIGKQKYKADLIPPALVIARYFSAEQAALETVEAEIATLTQAVAELHEEQGGEEGLLAEATDDKGAITKGAVRQRLDAIAHTPDADDERNVLYRYLDLTDDEASANKRLKEARKALDAKLAARYGKLSEGEIKRLVVEDKWFSAFAAGVQDELDRAARTLTGRIRQLADRYVTPLPQLLDEVATLAARVEDHLKKMGAV